MVVVGGRRLMGVGRLVGLGDWWVLEIDGSCPYLAPSCQTDLCVEGGGVVVG